MVSPSFTKDVVDPERTSVASVTATVLDTLTVPLVSICPRSVMFVPAPRKTFVRNKSSTAGWLFPAPEFASNRYKMFLEYWMLEAGERFATR